MATHRISPLDLSFVRAQFPALGSHFAFLDNAGGSQILGRVVDRISDYLLTSNVQLGASYAVSQRATERMQDAQRRTAELVNAERPEEVVMGPTSTLLVQLLARAMAHQFTPGDEVVVSRADHESNIGAWVGLESIGVIPRFWELNAGTHALELDDLDRVMSPRTKLVAFTHASNIFGTIHPVAAITRFVHDRGAKVCVDGVAYAPHRAIDVRAWDVDYYVLSLYKVYGPHHALLYGKYAHLLELANLYHYFIPPDRIPYKLQPGNVNYELSYGAIGIVDYLAELGVKSGESAGAPPRAQIETAFAAIADHERVLADRLLSYLATKPGVRVIGATTADQAVRVPTISFVVDGVDSQTIVRHIDTLQIGIRFGDFHSRRLVEHLDLARPNGVVRVSMVHYNTVGEIDRLIQGLDEVASSS
jgi:cysteine desulfurase family protein (TIGR01976 family)